MGALTVSVKAAAFAALLLCAGPAAADPLDRWSAQIAEASSRFGVPTDWIRRVMRAESGGRTTLGGRPIVNRRRHMRRIPATSRESDAASKDLQRRGFKFVGSTIIYAHMQATGMVNDHLVSCYRHAECAALARAHP